VYALIPVGENTSENALMESNGDGTLQAGATAPVARALESVNNSAGSKPARIKCEVV
jgi:hypothetical protein